MANIRPRDSKGRFVKAEKVTVSQPKTKTRYGSFACLSLLFSKQEINAFFRREAEPVALEWANILLSPKGEELVAKALDAKAAQQRLQAFLPVWEKAVEASNAGPKAQGDLYDRWREEREGALKAKDAEKAIEEVDRKFRRLERQQQARELSRVLREEWEAAWLESPKGQAWQLRQAIKAAETAERQAWNLKASAQDIVLTAEEMAALKALPENVAKAEARAEATARTEAAKAKAEAKRARRAGNKAKAKKAKAGRKANRPLKGGWLKAQKGLKRAAKVLARKQRLSKAKLTKVATQVVKTLVSAPAFTTEVRSLVLSARSLRKELAAVVAVGDVKKDYVLSDEHKTFLNYKDQWDRVFAERFSNPAPASKKRRYKTTAGITRRSMEAARKSVNFYAELPIVEREDAAELLARKVDLEEKLAAIEAKIAELRAVKVEREVVTTVVTTKVVRSAKLRKNKKANAAKPIAAKRWTFEVHDALVTIGNLEVQPWTFEVEEVYVDHYDTEFQVEYDTECGVEAETVEVLLGRMSAEFVEVPLGRMSAPQEHSTEVEITANLA